MIDWLQINPQPWCLIIDHEAFAKQGNWCSLSICLCSHTLPTDHLNTNLSLLHWIDNSTQKYSFDLSWNFTFIQNYNFELNWQCNAANSSWNSIVNQMISWESARLNHLTCNQGAHMDNSARCGQSEWIAVVNWPNFSESVNVLLSRKITFWHVWLKRNSALFIVSKHFKKLIVYSLLLYSLCETPWREDFLVWWHLKQNKGQHTDNIYFKRIFLQ